jgi:uncharacterized membrane protein YgcG
MRRKCLSIVVVLLLAMLLILPALAADYGVIYDETNMLETDKLIQLGTEILPGFTEEFGIDLRVDVLTDISDFENLDDAAAYLYEKYDYGCGDEKKGVSLTLVLSEDETGYTQDGWLEGWTLYTVGDDELYDHVTNQLLYSDINDYLNSGAWEGDLSEDAYALSMAVETFVNKMYGYYAPDRAPAGGTCVLPQGSRSHVFDTAGLMTEEELEKLEKAAEELLTKYDFGVYIVTVDDYLDYSNNNVFRAALNIYNANDFGTGEEKNGLLLLLSMKRRDFNLFTNGPRGEYAFNDAGRGAMTAFFLDDFGEDRWYDGFMEYLTWADRYLEKAEEGNPYSATNEPWDPFARNSCIVILILLIIFVPLIPAFISRNLMVKKMQSVEKGTDASAYVSQYLKLTNEDDTYIRTTRTERYNPPKEKSSGNGSRNITHERSGSASGTSGKF